MNKDQEIFSLDSFKNWIESQNKFESKIEKKYPLGVEVISKVNSKKLSKVMNLEDGQENRVVKDFMKNGGKIKEVRGKEFLIEVTMGSFYIKKQYVQEA